MLLTGASGFVGSHVLDKLLERGLETVVLLRPQSSSRFIERHEESIERRSGSMQDVPSLVRACAGITHVVHCAGATKAITPETFQQVNCVGARNLAEAAKKAGVTRFVHVSSLAAGGPATPENPAREEDPPRPVSEYGRTKLAGELEVQRILPTSHVTIRPPAVYGPRDMEFLRLFKAADSHVLPRPRRQPLSLVYVSDLAEAIAACVQHPAAVAQIFYVAADEVVNGRKLGEAIAAAMERWTIPLPLPTPLLWPVCLLAQLKSAFTRTPSVLSLQKYAEFAAPGWVCDASKIRDTLGITCATRLKDGVERTLAWYRDQGWLPNP